MNQQFLIFEPLLQHITLLGLCMAQFSCGHAHKSAVLTTMYVVSFQKAHVPCVRYNTVFTVKSSRLGSWPIVA